MGTREVPLRLFRDALRPVLDRRDEFRLRVLLSFFERRD